MSTKNKPRTPTPPTQPIVVEPVATPVIAPTPLPTEAPVTDPVDKETEVIDTVDELANAPIEPEPTPEPEAPAKSFLAALAETYGIETIPTVVDMVDARMQDYVSSMTGIRPIDTETGATHQTNLYYTIIMALEQDDTNHAMLALNVILNYMHVHSGDSFSERLVYRFFNALNIDSKKRAGFEKLLFTFLSLANPATRRKHVMRMDVNRIVDIMPSDLCKRNLLAFVSA